MEATLVFGNSRSRVDDAELASLRDDSVWSALQGLTARFGFHCWAYSAAPTCLSPSATPVRITTYPRDHVAECIDRNLYHRCPGLSFAAGNASPALFKVVRKNTPVTQDLRALLALNRQFRVTRGVVVPLHDFFGTVGMLALAFEGTDDQLDKLWRDQGGAITLQARELSAEVLQRHSRRFTDTLVPELSTRQREIVRLLSRGLSTAELAERLNVSIDTINKHTAAVKRCLGTRTTAQTTALAARWGLV